MPRSLLCDTHGHSLNGKDFKNCMEVGFLSSFHTAPAIELTRLSADLEMFYSHMVAACS